MRSYPPPESPATGQRRPPGDWLLATRSPAADCRRLLTTARSIQLDPPLTEDELQRAIAFYEEQACRLLAGERPSHRSWFATGHDAIPSWSRCSTARGWFWCALLYRDAAEFDDRPYAAGFEATVEVAELRALQAAGVRSIPPALLARVRSPRDREQLAHGFGYRGEHMAREQLRRRAVERRAAQRSDSHENARIEFVSANGSARHGCAGRRPHREPRPPSTRSSGSVSARRCGADMEERLNECRKHEHIHRLTAPFEATPRAGTRRGAGYIQSVGLGN